MDLNSTQIGPDDKKNMVRNFCLCAFFKTWLGLFHCLYLHFNSYLNFWNSSAIQIVDNVNAIP